MLSGRFSWFAVGVLLVASSASALPVTYYLGAGSKMDTVNGAGLHSVAVTGSVTLDDDGLGNVTLTDVSLSHLPVQVGLLPFISVVIDRPSIELASGPVVGTGSTLTSVLFGATDFDQSTGTVTCTDGALLCSSNGFPGPGTFPLPSPLTGVVLGTWNFAFSATQLTAIFQYGPTVSGSTDTLTIVAGVPEPGTALLLAAGLVGMALRRRAVL